MRDAASAAAELEPEGGRGAAASMDQPAGASADTVDERAAASTDSEELSLCGGVSCSSSWVALYELDTFHNVVGERIMMQPGGPLPPYLAMGTGASSTGGLRRQQAAVYVAPPRTWGLSPPATPASGLVYGPQAAQQALQAQGGFAASAGVQAAVCDAAAEAGAAMTLKLFSFSAARGAGLAQLQPPHGVDVHFRLGAQMAHLREVHLRTLHPSAEKRVRTRACGLTHPQGRVRTRACGLASPQECAPVQSVAWPLRLHPCQPALGTGSAVHLPSCWRS